MRLGEGQNVPLWEKVALEARRMRGLHPRKQTPHPSAMLRIASTLSHKGGGEEEVTPIIYAPKPFGEPATGTPPPDPTRITARPRSLVPSARKRNRPSIPAKPDGLVSTSGENRCGPCVRASAATSATAS